MLNLSNATLKSVETSIRDDSLQVIVLGLVLALTLCVKVISAGKHKNHTRTIQVTIHEYIDLINIIEVMQVEDKEIPIHQPHDLNANARYNHILVPI